MCFRPPTLSAAKVCPACGVKNPGIAKKCIKCKADLPEAEPEKIECPKCHTMNLPDAKACVNCGITPEEITAISRTTPKCPQCGAINRGLNTACTKCGTELFPFGE